MQTPARFWGAIFDVDGVLVDSPHEQAWREGLQQLMDNEWTDIRDQTSYAPEKFTPEVYQKQMSGKPRYAGAQAVLEYVGVPVALAKSLALRGLTTATAIPEAAMAIAAGRSKPPVASRTTSSGASITSRPTSVSRPSGSLATE
jgi:beta-phosphoglucomutase-like phosphatase (HAD superfamily)